VIGLPAGRVTGRPGISRTRALRILGNGAVPRQGANALQFPIRVTACPSPPPGIQHAPRQHMNRPVRPRAARTAANSPPGYPRPHPAGSPGAAPGTPARPV